MNKLKVMGAVFRTKVLGVNERKELEDICIGRGADIGCGGKKIKKECIGVDLYGNGELGEHGSQKGIKSVADCQSDGSSLPFFQNDELDFIVSCHNLEHFVNPLETLMEWKRVVKKGGKIGVIVPDNTKVDSMNLDRTHKTAFTLESLITLFRSAKLKIIDYGVALKNWSIFLIAEKEIAKN